MIPHKMKERHDPPNSYGDCIRVAIASILNIKEADKVPHFYFDGCSPRVAQERIDKYLHEQHGLACFSISFPDSVGVKAVMETIGTSNPGLHYLLMMKVHPDTPHVVVCRNSEIVNNPSPWPVRFLGGIDGLFTVVLFVTDELL